MTHPAVIDLLDALERHTQAVQANTAAVNSLLRQRVPSDHIVGSVIAGQLNALAIAAAGQLEQAQVLVDRLELLRQSLTIDQPPAATGREAPRESSTGPNPAT